MWTKNEGSLYAGCLLTALIWRTRDLRAAAAFAAGALPCAALLLWFKLGVAPLDALRAGTRNGAELLGKLDAFGSI